MKTVWGVTGRASTGAPKIEPHCVTIDVGEAQKFTALPRVSAVVALCTARKVTHVLNEDMRCDIRPWEGR